MHPALTSEGVNVAELLVSLKRPCLLPHLRLVENCQGNAPKVFARLKVFSQQDAKPSYKVTDPRTSG